MAPTKSQKISSNNSVRRNVASKLHLNDKVTPQSVAYAAIQVCVYVTVSCIVLCLSVTASSISTCKLRVLGLRSMVDSTIMDYITMLSISLKIPQGLLQRNVPRSYWVTQLVVNASVFPLLINIRLNSHLDRKIFPSHPPQWRQRHIESAYSIPQRRSVEAAHHSMQLF